MTDPSVDSTYSDDEIYRLVRRVMAEPQTDPAGLPIPAPTRAPTKLRSTSGAGVGRELSFDEILQKIRGDITLRG
jgi:hypothetical protein